MSSINKTEAQHRVDQIRAFQAELVRIEADEVMRLSGEQQGALTDYHDQLLSQYSTEYDIDPDQRARSLSLGMRIASFLGALALAASLFFLFYQFWGYLGTAVQVSILVAAPMLTFVATIEISKREKTGYFAKLMALVSFACFVLNLSMLGQIFNITPSDKALVVWAVFALLLAYACDIRLLLAVGILCVIAFLSARTGSWGGMYWLSFGERPENFFPAAIIMFCVPLFFAHDRFWGFAQVYRVFGLLTLLLPVLVLANWGSVSYIHADRDIVEGFYQLAGFVLSAAAVAVGVRKQWHDVVNTGNTFFVIFIYTKFFDWWWTIMPKYLFFLIVGLTALLFLMLFKRMRNLGIRLSGGEA